MKEVPCQTPGMYCLQAKIEVTELVRKAAVALYLVAMVALIVGIDVSFFRNQFLERLVVNVGIVLVFLAFYFRVFRRQ